jgi:iron complex outermembrane receptor protein
MRRALLACALLLAHPAYAGAQSSAAEDTLDRVVPIEGISVTSILAREGRSASAFTNVTKQDIEREYYGQDLPMLLMQTPGAYAYSDAGNGIGYSYLKIRGFASRRIGVTINGIPLNDPESREVYWIDHPDLAASAQEIQVQRGVGASTYGTTAIGGSVNVETVPYRQDRYLTLEAGAGSFGTQRYVAQGGRDCSTASTRCRRGCRASSPTATARPRGPTCGRTSSGSRASTTLVTRLNLYGGPEETHLAYLGVPKDYLDGAVTATRSRIGASTPSPIATSATTSSSRTTSCSTTGRRRRR